MVHMAVTGFRQKFPQKASFKMIGLAGQYCRLYASYETQLARGKPAECLQAGLGDGAITGTPSA